MGFLRDLFFGKGSSTAFRKIDWLDIESRWRSCQALAASTNQADVKQGVIQADIMIDSIMKQAGVAGTTFGERLKTLREQLPKHVYQKLWQAHIKRNELVHEPGSFVAEWEKNTHMAAFEQAMSTMRGMK
jgi:hypothetical protein